MKKDVERMVKYAFSYYMVVVKYKMHTAVAVYLLLRLIIMLTQQLPLGEYPNAIKFSG